MYGYILFPFSDNILCVCACVYDMSHERVLPARESTSRVAGAALADGVLMFCGRVTRLSPSLGPKTLAISSFKPCSHIIYSSNDTCRFAATTLQLQTSIKTNAREMCFDTLQNCYTVNNIC